MPVPGLLDAALVDPALAEIVALATQRGDVDITGPTPTRPFVVAAVGRQHPVLAVTATARESSDLVDALRGLVPDVEVLEMPGWETLPHERLSPSSDTVGRRISTLHDLAARRVLSGPLIVVAPIRAVMQPIIAAITDVAPITVAAGDDVALDDLARSLVAWAYERTDLVSKRGEFALRGGILDVFPPTSEHPVRLEFWGDTVEEIRWFSVADQRSLQEAPDGLVAFPCRELLLTGDVRARAAALVGTHPAISELLTSISEGIPVAGMESLAPLLSAELTSLVECLPQRTTVVLCEPERVRRRAHDLVSTSEEFLAASWHNAAVGNSTPIDLSAASYLDLAEVRRRALERGSAWWTLSPFATDDDVVVLGEDPLDGERAAARVAIDASAIDALRGDTEKAIESVRGWVGDGWAVALVAGGSGTADRWVESLRAEGIAGRHVAELAGPPPAGVATVTCAELDRGLLLPGARLAILTESDINGTRSSDRGERRMPSRRRAAIDPLELTAGDFVVHEQHGVGRYVTMDHRTVGNATREYLVIEYAPAKRGGNGDRLYVPSDQLDQVTRYIGGEAPTLHRLGGSDWTRTKARARRAVKEIAAELIRLYAVRMATKGRASGPDTPWQRELEDAFPYQETPDQQACIDEVKADMEREMPMDRLVCGDVGFGKTEIALRAAFKAVQDGRQVGVLVPTTLLVAQHTETFTERFAPFPMKVAALSRFQTDAEAKVVVEGLAAGTVDVVIGTHRLLGSQVRFKDLGLVVIDEEQRFGVEHKEHLKAMRADVDVLSLSATPIPRTLEMAVTGIRDMSTIQTPPEERHPVLTFVGPYDDKQVRAAIHRELLRDGQVFFVHNRVTSIERVATRIRELVPEARIRVAHGQMSDNALESVIVDFWDKAFDVLVCTTIVESGLDISNANTLIVDRADQLGLSQLHQIRGRVGRGRERGYAYFLYPAEQPLTETAHDRLATIAANTDLGSGMAVAMKDLEIRGAGNLLGGEQSGHIAEVGFDLYIRLVADAVAAFRTDENAPPPQEEPVRVDITVDANIPVDYIPSERLRLEAYKRLAGARSAEDLTRLREELLDRYGTLLEPVELLFAVASLRLLARAAGIGELVMATNHLRLSPVELAESRSLRLTRLYPGTLLRPATRTILVPRPKTAPIGGQPLRDAELIDWVATLLSTVFVEPQQGGTT